MTTVAQRARTPVAGTAMEPSRRRPARTRRSWSLTIVCLAALMYFLLPLYWLLIASTKSVSGLFHSFGLWFDHGGFDLPHNIAAVFTYQDGVYARWMGNTAVYAVISAGGAALIATLGGYGFAKFQFPGRRFLFNSVLGAIMVPATSLAIPTYLLFSHISLVNTPLAMILPSMVSPLGLYLMRVYAAEAVPDTLLDAARVDGANEAQIFTRIGFRMLRPGFVTVLLFTLVATWNNYFLPLIMFNDPKYYPVTVGLAQWDAQATGGGGAQAVFNLVITGSLLSVIPLLAAFLLLQRYWQSGLNVGAVRE